MMFTIYAIEILCARTRMLTMRLLKILFHSIFKGLAYDLIGLVLSLPGTFCVSFDKFWPVFACVAHFTSVKSICKMTIFFLFGNNPCRAAHSAREQETCL